MTEEQVILVNTDDEPIGLMGKLEAHQKGVLHRAFSVFITNSQGEIMLQQRAHEKYHSPGLWTNTCCSHQRAGETTLAAAHRRLYEEMGFDTELTPLFHFIYKASVDNGLTEHELDHVVVGRYDGVPVINREEVADWSWKSLEWIKNDLQKKPDLYTAWFRIIFEQYAHHLDESSFRS